jgi:hypothetical protein
MFYRRLENLCLPTAKRLLTADPAHAIRVPNAIQPLFYHEFYFLIGRLPIDFYCSIANLLAPGAQNSADPGKRNFTAMAHKIEI